MRSIALALVFGTLLVFAAQGFVRADEEEGAAPPAAEALQAMEGRLTALEAEVKYLRSREAALSRYVLANEARASGLQQLSAKMRAAGFAANSIPVDSREALLQGLDGLAGALREGLPQGTKDEAQLLKAAEKARKATSKK